MIELYILIWLLLWSVIFYFAYNTYTTILWNVGMFFICGLVFSIWPISLLFLWGWNKAKEHPY